MIEECHILTRSILVQTLLMFESVQYRPLSGGLKEKILLCIFETPHHGSGQDSTVCGAQSWNEAHKF